MDLPSVAAGAGILATIAAAVWFVMNLITKPINARMAELIVKDTDNTKAIARLDQQTKNTEQTALRHFAEDAVALQEIKSLIRDGQREMATQFATAVADLRREIREDTGEHRRVPR